MKYLLIMGVITLSACGNERPRPEIKIVEKVKLQSVSPDERLRRCKETPKKRNVADQASISVLLTQLFETIDDCRSKLNSTWEAIDKNKAEVERVSP